MTCSIVLTRETGIWPSTKCTRARGSAERSPANARMSSAAPINRTSASATSVTDQQRSRAIVTQPLTDTAAGFFERR